MKKNVVIFAASALLLCACTGNETPKSSLSDASDSAGSANTESSKDDYKMKWISPTGNVAVSFYDQGSNENWVTDLADNIRPQLLSNQFDAILFDGVAGLTVLSNNANSNYVFADWVTQGTFYVVSTKHTADDALLSNYTVDAFVEGGNASKAFRKLQTNWSWELPDGAITYEAGAPNVLSNLVGADAYDYYVLAEPALTNARALLNKQSKTLNVVFDLQAEWAKYYEGNMIPAGGLFVNKNTYANHKETVDKFIADVHTRLDTAIANPAAVKQALDEYEAIDASSDTDTSTRFGITGDLVYNLETNGNKLGFIKSGDVADSKAFADSFATLTGGKAFNSNLFLNK